MPYAIAECFDSVYDIRKNERSCSCERETIMQTCVEYIDSRVMAAAAETHREDGIPHLTVLDSGD